MEVGGQNIFSKIIKDFRCEKGKIDSDEIIDYHVSGDKIEVVDIPTGYTHNIINEGDTYFLKVNEEK